MRELDVVQGGQIVLADRSYGALITKHTQWARDGRKNARPITDYVERRFPGPGLVVSRRGVRGSWVFQFSEPRGTRFTTDENGEFLQDLDFTPYGEATSQGAVASDANFTPQQWNGGDVTGAFGLVRLGARFYDPTIGRFLSRDPLLIPRSATTTNPYAFAWNDPLNASDPSGLDVCAPESLSCLGGLATLGALGAYLFHQFGSSGGGVAPPAGASPRERHIFYGGYNLQLNFLRQEAHLASEEFAVQEALYDNLPESLAGTFLANWQQEQAFNRLSLGRQLLLSFTRVPIIGSGFKAGVNASVGDYGAAGLNLLQGGAEAALWWLMDAAPGLASISNESGAGIGGGARILSQQERLRVFYDRLQLSKPARTADEAFELLANKLNRVEDLHSGVQAVAEPGLKYTGRMYPPRADFTTRLPNGGLEALTKGQRIVFGPNGSIEIFSRQTNELLFSKLGR